MLDALTYHPMNAEPIDTEPASPLGPADEETDSALPEDDEVHTPFWTDEPSVLIQDWNELVPYGWFSPQRKGNALTRLGLLVGAFLLLNRLRGDSGPQPLFVLAVLAVSVLVVVMLTRKTAPPDCGETEDFGPAAGDGIGTVLDGAPRTMAGDVGTGQIFDTNERSLDRAMAQVGQDTAAADLEWMAGGKIERAAWGPFDETDTSTSGVVQPMSAGI